MEKRYLLLAGDNYYPSHGTGDWRGTFETEEEIRDKIKQIKHIRIITKGKNKGKEEHTHSTWKYKDREYDWYEIIDLKDYI